MLVSIGRLVHVVMDDRTVRPAIVTRVYSPTLVNVQVIPDIDDAPMSNGWPGLRPRRNVHYGVHPGNWRWPVLTRHNPVLDGPDAPHARSELDIPPPDDATAVEGPTG